MRCCLLAPVLVSGRPARAPDDTTLRNICCCAGKTNRPSGVVGRRGDPHQGIETAASSGPSRRGSQQHRRIRRPLREPQDPALRHRGGLPSGIGPRIASDRFLWTPGSTSGRGATRPAQTRARNQDQRNRVRKRDTDVEGAIRQHPCSESQPCRATQFIQRQTGARVSRSDGEWAPSFLLFCKQCNTYAISDESKLKITKVSVFASLSSLWLTRAIVVSAP